eukprot:g29329.t1
MILIPVPALYHSLPTINRIAAPERYANDWFNDLDGFITYLKTLLDPPYFAVVHYIDGEPFIEPQHANIFMIQLEKKFQDRSLYSLETTTVYQIYLQNVLRKDLTPPFVLPLAENMNFVDVRTFFKDYPPFLVRLRRRPLPSFDTVEKTYSLATVTASAVWSSTVPPSTLVAG